MLILIVGVTFQKTEFFNWITSEPESKISYIIRDASAKQQMNVLNSLLLCKIMVKAQKLLKVECWSQLAELTSYLVEQLVSIRLSWLAVYLTLLWDLLNLVCRDKRFLSTWICCRLWLIDRSDALSLERWITFASYQRWTYYCTL